MSTTNLPVTSTTNISHRTRASNATTRPGQIVLDAQTKRRSKAQKEQDDLAIKEAKDVKEAAVQKGVERLANIQVKMAAAQAEVLTNKVAPIRPKPRARKAKKATTGKADAGNHADNIMNDPLELEALSMANNDQPEEADDPSAVDNGTAMKENLGKVGKKVGKMLMKDAIDKAQKKIVSKVESGNADKARADGMHGRDLLTPWVLLLSP